MLHADIERLRAREAIEAPTYSLDTSPENVKKLYLKAGESEGTAQLAQEYRRKLINDLKAGLG